MWYAFVIPKMYNQAFMLEPGTVVVIYYCLSFLSQIYFHYFNHRQPVHLAAANHRSTNSLIQSRSASISVDAWKYTSHSSKNKKEWDLGDVKSIFESYPNAVRQAENPCVAAERVSRTASSRIELAAAQLFDIALAGGGAESINFQELASDLAEITFEY